MTKVALNMAARFVVLILVQVLIFNHINFMGYINPYIYILFIILFPVNNNRTLFVFLAFLLGFCVDVFSDSGGIHAAACVTLAFIRPVFLKFSFGMVYDYQSIKFSQTDFSSRLIYFSALIFIHHFIMYSLEIFNISKIILILQKTLFSSIFTILLCLIITILFSKKRK
ncbi:rod shape-determining protein MreD [Gelidibacter algens]|uniref:Rod shape-determining protein MreD n=1 Tax=Gelidibacter algens TaxID=49280 RepID=A0A1A7R3U4_9FLAO|nr:rod shape-determining protein MreD [Gelidibacter algens]OBX25442.1 rod shape-determining protein MreD [Gelidibacter algens]RAJ22347.1 rod shape-determining protein MreD [Gelidibacter algens]